MRTAIRGGWIAGFDGDSQRIYRDECWLGKQILFEIGRKRIWILFYY
jgi:hypothetical protein